MKPQRGRLTSKLDATTSLPRIAVLLCVSILLAGCASIPLATMWKMRNFGNDDLARVQARAVRLAIGSMPPALQPEQNPPELQLSLYPKLDKAPPETYVFSMKAAQTWPADLIPDDEPQDAWAVYALDENGIAAWQRLKPKLQSLEKQYKKAAFATLMNTEFDFQQKRETITFSARLFLNAEQGPLTLLDHVEAKVTWE